MAHGKTICVYNIKGGVGKTTTIFNLAAVFADRGFSVLMIDIDPQPSLTVHCGYPLISQEEKTIYQVLRQQITLQEAIHTIPCPDQEIELLPRFSSHIKLVPADLNLIAAERELPVEHPAWGHILQEALDPIRKQFDYILIDCPGAATVLTTNAILASAAILCPVECADMAIQVYSIVDQDIQRLARRRQRDYPIYVLRTKLGNNNHSRVASTTIEKALGDQVFQTIIQDRTVLKNAMSWKQPIIQFATSADVASAYRALGQEVIERV